MVPWTEASCSSAVSQKHLVLCDRFQFMRKPCVIHCMSQGCLMPICQPCLVRKLFSEKCATHKMFIKNWKLVFPSALLRLHWNERNCYTAPGFTRLLPGLLGYGAGSDCLFPDFAVSYFVSQTLLIYFTVHSQEILVKLTPESRNGYKIQTHFVALCFFFSFF